MNIIIAAVLIPLILRTIPADPRANQAVTIPWLTAGLLTIAAMRLVGGPSAFAEGGLAPWVSSWLA